MKSAFLIIDMQKQFLDSAKALSPGLDEALEIINHVADLFRQAGRPVILTQDAESEGPGEPGFALVDGLVTADSDLRVEKVACNPFRRPELEEMLSQTGSESVLLAGFKAEACVLSTQKGAEDRDIPSALLRGAILSDRSDTVAFIERICPIVSYEVVATMV